ncbi:MAG TPA: ASKHA domain-containing protein [Acidimicrobiia bacterium]|nr:ASKHA domain-containing protein [Acidimicrobiia bacterium]
MSDTVRVIFLPSGRRGEVARGTTVLAAARELGVDLDSVCGGRGICGRCQISQGSTPAIPADPTAVSPPGELELEYRGRRPLGEGRRLGCATAIWGDLVVDVPPESQVHRQVVRKRPEVTSYPIDPVVRLHYVEVEPPSLTDARSDLDRVTEALAEEWGLARLEFDHDVTTHLHRYLIEGRGSVTVAVHSGRHVIAVWPGFHDRLLGLAFDVGSTTLAGHLLDLTTGDVLASAGAMNPQIRFGEDLMSRVSYAMMNDGGAAEMTQAVRSALDSLAGELLAEAGESREDVVDVVVVGNPIMHHLVLGFDPRPLGEAPFAPAVRDAFRSTASSIGLRLATGARLYVLPIVAGHVGADTMAAVLSEGAHRHRPLQLLVDVGTNAEIVLGNEDRLLAASSPTGPAFEGAQITHGQRATPGAIERVRIDPVTLEPRIRVIGSDRWSDEAGFAEETAGIGINGICGSGIIEAVAELRLAGVVDRDGVIHPRGDRVMADGRTFSYRLWDEPPITITQTDVRAIQLAKAALYAGTRLLMDRMGVDAVDEIRLAGAFGSHIDPKYAMILGLIPDCDLDRVSAAGNAAGSGAMIALLSASARGEIEEVARRIEKVETATEPRFQEHFVAAMGIPHSSHEFPHLSDVLPPSDPRRGSRRGGRRSRERSRR